MMPIEYDIKGFAFQNFSPLECDPPSNPRKVSSEAQDGEETASRSLSVAALKANLFYAEAMRQKAYNYLAIALVDYHLALTDLNQAICKRNSRA